MAVDFTNYLSAPIESFEAPKAPPVGHWFATIKDFKVTERDFKVRKGVVCTLSFTLTGPDSDITEEFPDAEMKRARIERDYALDGDRPQQHILRELAEQQLQLPVAGLTFGEVLEAMKGHDVKLQLDQRFDDNGQAWPVVKRVLSAHD